MKRSLCIAALAAASIMAGSVAAAHAASATIAGTHTVSNANVNATYGNYRPFSIDTSVLFQPTLGPVTVTGSVDPSGLPAGSAVFVGLISKARYDAWVTAGYDPTNTQTSFFGFIDTAYGVFNQQSLTKERFGIGQQITTADTTQQYAGTNIAEGPITNFSLTFDASSFSGTYGATTKTLNYVPHYNYLAGGTVATDFSGGAYAFVGTFFNKTGGSVPLDVTFRGPTAAVPLPSAAGGGLALLGAIGLVLLRRERLCLK
jgi:hypothetical protein